MRALGMPKMWKQATDPKLIGYFLGKQSDHGVSGEAGG